MVDKADSNIIYLSVTCSILLPHNRDSSYLANLVFLLIYTDYTGVKNPSNARNVMFIVQLKIKVQGKHCV